MGEDSGGSVGGGFLPDVVVDLLWGLVALVWVRTKVFFVNGF